MQDTLTEILIEGLHLQCRVGVPMNERRAPQTIAIDLAIQMKGNPAKDAVAETVDYGAVVSVLKELMAAEPPRVTLEFLARRIAETVFNDDRILRLDVKLRKIRKLESCDAVGVRRVFFATQGVK